MPLVVDDIPALQEQVCTALWRLKDHNCQWLEEAIVSFDDTLEPRSLRISSNSSIGTTPRD
jgi:hypothetical protein